MLDCGKIMSFLWDFKWMLIIFKIQQLKMPTKKMYFTEDQSFKAETESVQSAPSNYNIISFRKRIRLIEMVCVQRQQIIQAASSLGIKLSTAKYILRSFRKEGKVLQKNEDKSVEDQNLKSKLQEIKLEVEKINKKKTEKKEQKLEKLKNKVRKISSLNYKKDQISNQLIQKIHFHNEKQGQESKTFEPITLYDPQSNKGSQQYFLFMFYNPLWPYGQRNQTINA